MDGLDIKLSLAYDERINRIVASIMRVSTGEVIRQIPPEEVVEIMARLHEDIRGLVVDHTG